MIDLETTYGGRVAVSSSTIASVGYNVWSRILTVGFHSGGVYQYFDVPSDVHAGLMNASSKGGYFHRVIKDRFRFRQIR